MLQLQETTTMVIPFKFDKPVFPKILYTARARIEQAVGKLKRFKRIALRCKNTAQNYGSLRGSRIQLHLGQIRPHGLTNNDTAQGTGRNGS
jgi:hypothetical protein